MVNPEVSWYNPILQEQVTTRQICHSYRLTLKSVDKILCCHQWHETSSAVLSHGTIYLGCSSNVLICGQKVGVCEFFKWPLQKELLKSLSLMISHSSVPASNARYSTVTCCSLGIPCGRDLTYCLTISNSENYHWGSFLCLLTSLNVIATGVWLVVTISTFISLLNVMFTTLNSRTEEQLM